MFGKLDFEPLKGSLAKFKASKIFGVIVTFPTPESAAKFLQECEQDYIDVLDERRVYLSLEFAADMYHYPGADFSSIDELNAYTGYKKEPIKKSSSMNDQPTFFSKAQLSFEGDTFNFKKETDCAQYYSDEECAKFVGKKSLDDADGFHLEFLENCTTFRTLAFYLVSKHGYDAHFAAKIINDLERTKNDPETITPVDVFDYFEKNKSNYIDSLKM